MAFGFNPSRTATLQGSSVHHSLLFPCFLASSSWLCFRAARAKGEGLCNLSHTWLLLQVTPKLRAQKCGYRVCELPWLTPGMDSLISACRAGSQLIFHSPEGRARCQLCRQRRRLSSSLLEAPRSKGAPGPPLSFGESLLRAAALPALLDHVFHPLTAPALWGGLCTITVRRAEVHPFNAHTEGDHLIGPSPRILRTAAQGSGVVDGLPPCSARFPHAHRGAGSPALEKIEGI